MLQAPSSVDESGRQVRKWTPRVLDRLGDRHILESGESSVVNSVARADLEDGGVVCLSRRTLFDLAFFDLRAGFCQVQVDLLGAGTEGVAQRLETLHLLEQTLLGDGGFLGEFLRIGA